RIPSVLMTVAVRRSVEWFVDLEKSRSQLVAASLLSVDLVSHRFSCSHPWRYPGHSRDNARRRTRAEWTEARRPGRAVIEDAKRGTAWAGGTRCFDTGPRGGHRIRPTSEPEYGADHEVNTSL